MFFVIVRDFSRRGAVGLLILVILGMSITPVRNQASNPAVQTPPTFNTSTIDYPGASNTDAYGGPAMGINNQGVISGQYVDASSPCNTDAHSVTHCGQGFLASNGAYTSINAPEAVYFVHGINDKSAAVGDYAQYFYGVSNGFYYNITGNQVTQVPAAPGSCSGGIIGGEAQTATGAEGINDYGTIVGGYEDCSGNVHGFILTGFPGSSYSFTSFDVPGASPAWLAYANSINNEGQIVGWYQSSTGQQEGFLRYPNSTFSTISYPPSQSPTGSVRGTVALAINDLGAIVGYYADGNNIVHNFILTNGIYTSAYVPGSADTAATGINNNGQIVGWYLDPAGKWHGFQTTAASFTAAIPVGIFPTQSAVNPSTNTVYVANAGSGTVSVIDGATDTVLTNIPVASGTTEPQPVAVNSATDTIYVGTDGPNNYGPGMLQVINGKNNTIVATIPVGCFPNYIAVNPNNNRVYVTNGNEGTISVIDGSSNSLVTTINVGLGVRGIAINPATNLGYVAEPQQVNQGSCTVFGSGSTVGVINLSTNTVVGTIRVGQLGSSSDVAINPNTNMVYVANSGSGTISVISGGTNTVIQNITLPGVAADPYGLGVDPSTNRIWVGSSAGSGTPEIISVIDGSTNTVVDSFSLGLAGCCDVQQIGVNPNTLRVYVPVSASSNWGSQPGNLVVVSDAFDFGLIGYGAITVPQGGQGTVGIGVDRLAEGSFSAQVALSCASGLPPGASCSFAPDLALPTFNTTLTVSTLPSTPTGTYTETVMGAGGGITHATTLTLTVTAGFDYALSASPTGLVVHPGTFASTMITAALVSGSSQTVFLTVSGLPSGTTSTLSRSSGAPSFTSNLNVTTSVSTPTGIYIITVTGTGGGVTHTAQFDLSVVGSTGTIGGFIIPLDQSVLASLIGLTIGAIVAAVTAFYRKRRRSL